MSKVADIQFTTDAIMVSGDLDFDNVDSLYVKSIAKFPDYTQLMFDFTNVTSSNSAALAFIIELIKTAKAQNKQIRFKSLSKDIVAIASASGLDELIQQ